MYAYLKGVVADKGQNELVLDVNGVGYLLSVSMNTLQETPPQGETMKVYTYLSVREDAMELFGFATREERSMYLKLLSVSGIGPKLALAILSAMPLRDLTLAIVTGDATALSRAPGVGKKTAQRLALELKEKVSWKPWRPCRPWAIRRPRPPGPSARYAGKAIPQTNWCGWPFGVWQACDDRVRIREAH